MNTHRLAAVAALFLFPFASASGGPVTYQSADGRVVTGQRCASENAVPPAEYYQVLKRGIPGAQRLMMQAGVSIPVAFHVITDDDGNGDVPGERLQAQIAILNAAYADAGFSFTLASVDRTANSSWYRAAMDSYDEMEMKWNLAAEVADRLNVYTSSPRSGDLGWSSFPWDYGSESDFRHGVVVLNESLPGGSAAPYDQGHTATHEIGHFLGLLHTFENGCRAPGDFVGDTEAEAEPAWGCPVGRDTCRRGGLDPVDNYMNYSNDACMTAFTATQMQHMQVLAARFRPGLFD